MNRRQFVKICTATAGLNALRAERLLAAEIPAHRYGRARLVNGDGEPVRLGSLSPGQNYLFHYPYVTTPALLVRLPESSSKRVRLQTGDGNDYVWKGGVGPAHDVVAFSAICTHQLSAVLKRKAFISFRAAGSKVSGRANTIVCCAHHSVYDPMQGGRVLSGPAPQPLTAILLEYNAASDGLEAVGTTGAELFVEFFQAYRREIIDEFGRGDPREKVTGDAALVRMEDYVVRTVGC